MIKRENILKKYNLIKPIALSKIEAVFANLFK